MTTDQIITSGGLTEIASADLSASLYCGVVRNSSGQVELPSAGGHIDGVLYSQPTAAGMACVVMPLTAGEVIIKAGGSFNPGVNLKVAATGKFLSASAAEVAAGSAVARSKAASTGDNKLASATAQVNAPVAVSGIQSLVGAGAIDAETLVTEWEPTSDNATMDDGIYVGQTKKVRIVGTVTGNNTLTPDTVSASTVGGTTPASVVVTHAGQVLDFEWRADGWKIYNSTTAGVAAVADAGTANLLHALHTFAVAGTDTVTLPDGWYPGQEFIGTVISAASTPISVMSGKFHDEDGSADGVTATADPADVSDQVIARWGGTRWIVVDPTYVVAP